MRRFFTGRWMPPLAALALLLTSAPGSAQDPAHDRQPPLAAVLSRATSYVDELQERLIGVVMEERYEQRASAGFLSRGPSGERVTLLSDYLLVRLEGSVRPYGFRDVFEANGRAVRDREERLTQLFLSPTVTMSRQIEGILRESARYNVGDIERNTNTPTLALLFLTTSYKPRFEFDLASDTSPDLGMEEPDDVTGVRVIGYRETWPTSIIRRRGGGDVPARGRYWVEQETGRILITELILESGSFDSITTTRYAENETMGHAVPVEMRERYINNSSRQRVDGTATYTRFRRFQVLVDESEPFRD